VIVEYFNANDCTIGFEDGHLAKKVKFGEIKRGEIKNNFHRSVFGIGYFGVGLAKSSIKSKLITPYITWLNMMKRCYDKEYQKKKQPTYIGCIVCDEWHNFNTFNTWFNENYIDGFAIDKDIIIKNNKIYSPETCCFVPK
jgi:predicted transport protein